MPSGTARSQADRKTVHVSARDAPDFSATPNMLAADSKKPLTPLGIKGFAFGGLGRNRTTDTRIFNPRKQKMDRRSLASIPAPKSFVIR